MKTRKLFAIASVIAVMLAGCAKTEDIEKLQEQIDQLQNERIKTVEEQVAGIKNSLGPLQTAETELQGFIETLTRQEQALDQANRTLEASIASLKTELTGDLTAAEANCLGQLEAYKTTVSTELASIRSAITALQEKDTDLQTQITNLKTYIDGGYQAARDWASSTFVTLQNYNTTAGIVAALQTQVSTILQDIQSLVNDNSPASRTDLATAISGLREEAQADIQQTATDISTKLGNAVDEITSAYTSALNDALTAIDLSMKSWINSLLTGYADIVSADARMLALQQSLEGQIASQKSYLEGLLSALSLTDEGNAAMAVTVKAELDSLDGVVSTNATDISRIRADLATATEETIDAYNSAIATAVNTLDGKLSAELTTALNGVNANITTKMGAVEGAVTALNGRVTAAEDAVTAIQTALLGITADIADLLARVQSLAVVPTYDDGSVAVTAEGFLKADVVVKPLATAQALAEAGAGIFNVKAVYTQTKAESRFVNLPVSAVSFDGEALTLTADASGLDDAFFGGAQSVSARVGISDGSNSMTSDYFPLYPAPPTDISAAGTANCYIVSEPGMYRFNALVKGNSTESVGTPVSAEVLWETKYNSTAVGDVIKSVSYADGFVVFATKTPLVDGNALIAVKDASDNILWSWHIWVSAGFDPVATGQVYLNDAGTFMDRNLGALSNTPGDSKALGLYYQWGRKDPFQKTGMSREWPTAVASNSTTGTIDYSVQHPNTYINASNTNYDWYYTGNTGIESTRWQDEVKTKYDPCPNGWRVPYTDAWTRAFSCGYWTYAPNVDRTNGGINFGTSDRILGHYPVIWYPLSGEMWANLNLYNIGTFAYYWSSGAETRSIKVLDFTNGGRITPYANGARPGYGYPVRCMAETPTHTAPAGTDLSASGTANCYIVSSPGTYRFRADVKGNSNESTTLVSGMYEYPPLSAGVEWETKDTDSIQPREIIDWAYYSDGYVTFKTPSTLVDGNALIAIRMQGGTILWSWHIWVCKDYDPAASAQVYSNNAGTFMDRNLGATRLEPLDARSHGMLYQWGRKDPFPTRSVTGEWSTVTSGSYYGSPRFIDERPAYFLTPNSLNSDWLYTGDSSHDDTLWGSTKTKYDPCPKGWKVPDAGAWETAFGGHGSWNWSQAIDNDGLNMGVTPYTLGSASMIWYPAVGQMTDGLQAHNTGSEGGYWYNHPSSSGSDTVDCMRIGLGSTGATVNCNASAYRYWAQSIRCQAE